MDKEIEKIRQLGKDSIIEIALDLIDKNLKIKNFKFIKVWASKASIKVSFYTPIKYLKRNSVYYFDVYVDIIEKQVSYGPISNPKDFNISKNKISFYIETPDDKRHLDFVINSINKSGDIGSINDQIFEDNLIIREKRKYYDVNVISDYMESWYKVDKLTGEISNSGHAHIEPQPEEENETDIYEEIK